ncbi:MAG: right-handed parallel beta-helix repeat-containing protein [Clostridia bacterium]|nr:right-handed parallel beta-helix repeat-containing protein [Clostridia bacterium]
MSTIFDITAYGAVGDGKTDCTKAIQAALDDAAQCRGVVTVPPGTYLTGKLTMGKGVSLEGHAAWSFRSYGASIFELNDPDAECLLDITGAFGCAIRGMSLNGKHLGKNIHGVKLYWDKYNGGSEEDTPTIDDCRIGHFTGDGVHLEHIWCFSVRHSMICFNAGAGLYIDGWDGFILDNWFSGNRMGGMTGGPCCASVTATGNRVEWNRLAGFYLPNSNCCNITGNYFDRSGGPALVLGTEKGSSMAISVTGNLIYRSGKPYEDADRNPLPFEDPYDNAHIRMTNCQNATITGNTFRLGRDDNGVGVFSPAFTVVMKNCHHCAVRSNSWGGGCLQEGFVDLGGCHDMTVGDNIGYPENPNK